MRAIFLSAATAFLGVSSAFAQGETMPLEKATNSGGQVVAYRQDGISLTVDPATAVSQSTENGVTNSLQQQMQLAVLQAVTPWLSLAYGAGAGFRSQEIQLLRQEDQSTANLTMLNRPALNWKPREGVEIEAAYEMQQNLSRDLVADQSETAKVQGKIKVNPKTTVGLSYQDRDNTAANGDRTASESIRMTSEYALSALPLTLQINPGYENATAVDQTHAIRAFLENAVIWKVDSNTTLTVGAGFAGGGNSSSSQSASVLVQHIVIPGTALELRAAMLNGSRNTPGQGFSVSAGSTVALAQALSAGLSVRYKMDQNPVVDRPQNETFLSLSISGRF